MLLQAVPAPLPPPQAPPVGVRLWLRQELKQTPLNVKG